MPVTVRLRMLPAGSRKRAAVPFLHLRRLVIRAHAEALLVFLLFFGLAASVISGARTARAFAGPGLVVWHGGPPKLVFLMEQAACRGAPFEQRQPNRDSRDWRGKPPESGRLQANARRAVEEKAQHLARGVRA